MLTRSRARSIGWAVILSLCLGLTLALTFRVNAVKSQVRLAERKIVALRLEKGLLETEFETRSNQQQLRALNDVEFGYQAPTAAQYLESERQLAALGKPRGPGAPDMIRVAQADPADAKDTGLLPTMANPLTGRVIGDDAPRSPERPRELARTSTPATLAERLGRVEAEGKERPAGKAVERLSHIEKTARGVGTGALAGSARTKPLSARATADKPAAGRAAAAKPALAKAGPSKDSRAKTSPAKPVAAKAAAKPAGQATGKPATKAPRAAERSAGKPARTAAKAPARKVAAAPLPGPVLG